MSYIITDAKLRLPPYSITTTEADTSRIADEITIVEDRIHNLYQRFDKQAAVTKKANGTGNEILFPPERVISFTAIKMNDTTLTSDDLALILFNEVNPITRGWTLHWKRGPWLAGSSLILDLLDNAVVGRHWIKGFKNVEITGDWGFSSVPKIVERAAGLLILREVRDSARFGNDPQYDSENTGGYSYSKSDKGRDSVTGDARIDELLKPYRKPIVHVGAQFLKSTPDVTPTGGTQGVQSI